MPTTATANRMRCREKYLRVPDAKMAPAASRNMVPIQNTPDGVAIEVDHPVIASLPETIPMV